MTGAAVVMTMPHLFQSGLAADIILLVIAGEAIWLRVRERWFVIAILCRLMPGAMMVLAVRAALTGQNYWWIAGALMLSFPFHLADLRFGPGQRTKK